ncbi:transposable element Tcb2 transposase [Trichonephila clavipes]|nr:transposable element Tcb2 transposase [Trichonephila clavipes]
MVGGVFFVALFGIFGACLNVIRYVEFFHLFMMCYYPLGNGVSSKTTLPVTSPWLDEYSSDFSVIYWPPRSPDLNPIEHFWNVLEQGVKGCHTAPTNLTEL